MTMGTDKFNRDLSLTSTMPSATPRPVTSTRTHKPGSCSDTPGKARPMSDTEAELEVACAQGRILDERLADLFRLLLAEVGLVAVDEVIEDSFKVFVTKFPPDVAEKQRQRAYRIRDEVLASL